MTSTALTRMQAHLAEHIYKRGAFEGDAPLETTTNGRKKTHLRITKPWSNAGVVETMAVRMWATDILPARADGTVVINCNGHGNKPTTRKALNIALRKFIKGRTHIHTGGLSSNKVAVYYANGKEYVYYDGMVIDGNTGEVVSEKYPFKKIGIDKEHSAEFMRGVKESGFKALFPMLWSNCDAPGDFNMFREHSMTYTLTHAEEAAHWAGIVSRNAFRTMWSGIRTYEKLPKEVVWANLMKHCKQTMYKHIVTDIYAIQK